MVPPVPGLPSQADAARQITLWVHVHEQHLLVRQREGRREVDGGRGLADAALLVGDGNDTAPHAKAPKKMGAYLVWLTQTKHCYREGLSKFAPQHSEARPRAGQTKIAVGRGRDPKGVSFTSVPRGTFPSKPSDS